MAVLVGRVVPDELAALEVVHALGLLDRDRDLVVAGPLDDHARVGLLVHGLHRLRVGLALRLRQVELLAV
jgi:hypothetical protein